ncbi:CotH kinase family protein [Patescibacteria group bacterium]
MKKNKFRFIKKFLIGLAIFTLILFFLQFAWLGYKASFKVAKLLPQSYQQFLNIAHFKVRNNLIDFIDSFSFKTHLHSSFTQKLPQLDLIMSTSDLDDIQNDISKSMQLGYNDKQAVNESQINLIYNNTNYPAKVSLHGGGANNNIFYKTDYNIKLTDSQKINNLSSFTLFNPAIHYWIVPQLTNKLAEQLDLHFAKQYPIKLAINSQNYGIYLLEEKINDEFLLNHNLSNAEIIKLRDTTRLAHRDNTIALDAHHLSGFDLEIANIAPFDKPNPSALFRLNQLFKTIKNQNVDDLSQFFDLDYLARFDAYREFFGVNHNTTGDNLAMFYSALDDKFYPIVRSEGDLNKLIIQDGTTLKSFNNYDSHIAQQYNYPRLFLLLHRLPQFRVLKYQYLNQLISNYPQLKKDFDDIYDQYADVFIYDTADEASVRHKKSLLKRYQSVIDHNYSLIKQQLEFAQVAINIINQLAQATIEIVPDSVMPIAFDSFELVFANNQSMDITNTINQKTIMAGFSDDFNLIPTTYSYTLNLPSQVASLNVKAKNNITGEPIEDVYVGIASVE